MGRRLNERGNTVEILQKLNCFRTKSFNIQESYAPNQYFSTSGLSSFKLLNTKCVSLISISPQYAPLIVINSALQENTFLCGLGSSSITSLNYYAPERLSISKS